MAPALGFIFPSFQEWVVIIILGLLLFGRRLPEVGRQVARTIHKLRQGFYALKAELEADTGLDEIRDIRAEITGAGQRFKDDLSGVTASTNFAVEPERRMFHDLTDESLATPGPAIPVAQNGAVFDAAAETEG